MQGLLSDNDAEEVTDQNGVLWGPGQNLPVKAFDILSSSGLTTAQATSVSVFSERPKYKPSGCQHKGMLLVMRNWPHSHLNSSEPKLF
jgi:hypothetical protein